MEKCSWVQETAEHKSYTALKVLITGIHKLKPLI